MKCLVEVVAFHIYDTLYCAEMKYLKPMNHLSKNPRVLEEQIHRVTSQKVSPSPQFLNDGRC